MTLSKISNADLRRELAKRHKNKLRPVATVLAKKITDLVSGKARLRRKKISKAGCIFDFSRDKGCIVEFAGKTPGVDPGVDDHMVVIWIKTYTDKELIKKRLDPKDPYFKADKIVFTFVGVTQALFDLVVKLVESRKHRKLFTLQHESHSGGVRCDPIGVDD